MPAHPVAIVLQQLEAVLQKGLAGLDAPAFAQAWEAMRVGREQCLVHLARMARQAVAAGAPMDQVARHAIDFGFAYLSKRQVVMLADVLAMALESEAGLNEATQALAQAAGQSPHGSRGRIEAVVMGASGMHRFEPAKVAQLDAMDLQPPD